MRACKFDCEELHTKQKIRNPINLPARWDSPSWSSLSKQVCADRYLKSMKVLRSESTPLWLVLILYLICPYALAQSPKDSTDSLFTGRYQAAYSNTNISSEILEVQNFVTGYFYMDGDRYQIIATRDKNVFHGKVVDESKGRFYDVSSRLNGDVLNLSITFPESGNRVVELRLTRVGAAISAPQTLTTQPVPVISDNREKSPRLVGTWRYTEVLSSGSGGNFASLATDHFIQFKANGECLSWSGQSAGGSADASFANSGAGTVSKEAWYTHEKSVIFVNLQTKAETRVAFAADQNRLMFKGRSTKVYQRVQ